MSAKRISRELKEWDSLKLLVETGDMYLLQGDYLGLKAVFLVTKDYPFREPLVLYKYKTNNWKYCYYDFDYTAAFTLESLAKIIHCECVEEET